MIWIGFTGLAKIKVLTREASKSWTNYRSDSTMVTYCIFMNLKSFRLFIRYIQIPIKASFEAFLNVVVHFKSYEFLDGTLRNLLFFVACNDKFLLKYLLIVFISLESSLLEVLNTCSLRMKTISIELPQKLIAFLIWVLIVTFWPFYYNFNFLNAFVKSECWLGN